MHQEPNDNRRSEGKAPGGLFWPIRRLGWFLEKYLLWPIADSFRSISDSLRYRSPLAYIGGTLMITVTAGAIVAAVYFYNQSEDQEAPVLAQVPTETVVPPVPTPTPAPTTVEDTTPNSGNAEDTLQGVVPNFTRTAKKNRGNAKQKKPRLPATVVRPAPAPKSPPLKVAHRFATTFVNYEVGDKGAAKKFRRTATAKLAKELRDNPPKLPSTGQIPKATVVNVVRGKKTGGTLAVSVSLMRSGAASELRLGLARKKGEGWQVSEVRG